MKKILVVKLADFGDALLTTPAIRALRVAYPGARLDVLTTPGSADVIRRSGLVDTVWTLEHRDPSRRPDRMPLSSVVRVLTLRREGYDATALMHRLTTRGGSLKHAALMLLVGSPVRAGLRAPGRRRGWFLNRWAPDGGFSAMHTAEAGLAVAAVLGAPSAGRELAFNVDEPSRSAAAAALESAEPMGPDITSASPLVAIHPGGGPYSLARRWPPEYFAAVADGLAGFGCRVLLVGQAADDCGAVRQAMATKPVDLTDRTDLSTLAAVLERCDLLVTNDSGVMHLGSAVRTRVLAVFGPSNPAAWGPWPRGKVVTLDIPCRPCFYVGHALGSPTGCATRDCLRWLRPAVVLEEAQRLLSLERATGAAERDRLAAPAV